MSAYIYIYSRISLHLEIDAMKFPEVLLFCMLAFVFCCH